MFKKNLKYLELPDLPDFKGKEKLSVSKPTKKEELIEIVKKPKSREKAFKKEKTQEKKLKKKSGEKKIKPKHHFILKGGHRIKSMKELKESIKFMDKHTFDHHVKKDKNDFAEWIMKVIKDKGLAEKIKKASNRENILNHLEFREKEKEIVNKVKMLENELKERDKLIAKSDGELRKKQTQIEKLTESQAPAPEAGIEKKGMALRKKWGIIKRKEKIIREEQKELERKRKEFGLIEKGGNEIDKKDARFKAMKKELEELKEKQKTIEKNNWRLKREARSFLKREKRIGEKNEFLKRLINKNKEIKDNLLSEEKLLVDKDNELRKKEKRLLKEEIKLEKKRKEFEDIKTELNKFKERQKDIEENEEILAGEVRLFLKKEQGIEGKSRLLKNLIAENEKIKENLLSKEKSLVDSENKLRRKEQELSKEGSLLEEKEGKGFQIPSPERIEQSIKRSKKEKVKLTKKAKKEKLKEIKKIEKEEICFMIKDMGDYVARGDISGAKHTLLRVKKSYNKLNKQDKESLKYDIIALETDIKLASLNL